jgi:predicted nucleic acid-binding protein
MSDPLFVYWDSSVWVSYFLDDKSDPKQDQTRIAFIEQNMNSVEKGSEIILISDLILLELVGVLRERIIQKQKYEGFPKKKKEELRKIADNKVTESLSFIRNLANAKKAIKPSSKMLVSDLYRETSRILNYSIFGEIKSKDICKKCRREIPPEYNLKYPGHYDIQHALLALERKESIPVSKIISTDEAFLQFQSLKEFSDVEICTPHRRY